MGCVADRVAALRLHARHFSLSSLSLARQYHANFKTKDKDELVKLYETIATKHGFHAFTKEEIGGMKVSKGMLSNAAKYEATSTLCGVSR